MSGPAAVSQRASDAPLELLSATTRDFSLVLGGPIYQYLLRVGLLKAPLDRVKARILVLTLLAWALGRCSRL